jgi:hypothetical protein
MLSIHLRLGLPSGLFPCETQLGDKNKTETLSNSKAWKVHLRSNVVFLKHLSLMRVYSFTTLLLFL